MKLQTLAQYNKSLSADVTQNVPPKLNARQRHILQLIEEDNTISAATMANQLGVTLRTIRRNIETMRQDISITWTGAAKTGYWEIIK